jgi:hypothetical protein
MELFVASCSLFNFTVGSAEMFRRAHCFPRVCLARLKASFTSEALAVNDAKAGLLIYHPPLRPRPDVTSPESLLNLCLIKCAELCVHVLHELSERRILHGMALFCGFSAEFTAQKVSPTCIAEQD